MAQNELTLTIPVGDWDDEYIQEEPEITAEDDLIKLAMQKGYGPQKIGRLAVIARERQAAPDNILSANKLLLNAGAAVEISSMISRRKVKAELPDGREIEVREFVAPVREEAEDEGQATGDDLDRGALPPSPSPADFKVVSFKDPLAVERAEKYLHERVPGYVYGRLSLIAVNGGDVAAAARKLKKEIDKQVALLK
jgi:hypothetical protein